MSGRGWLVRRLPVMFRVSQCFSLVAPVFFTIEIGVSFCVAGSRMAGEEDISEWG